MFLEHLKRSSSEKAVQWGQADLKEDEILRPQFEGKKRRSPVTDDLSDPWYPIFKRALLIVFTTFILLLMILLSLGFSAGLFVARYYLAVNTWHLNKKIAWAVMITAIA